MHTGDADDKHDEVDRDDAAAGDCLAGSNVDSDAAWMLLLMMVLLLPLWRLW